MAEVDNHREELKRIRDKVKSRNHLGELVSPPSPEVTEQVKEIIDQKATKILAETSDALAGKQPQPEYKKERSFGLRRISEEEANMLRTEK